MFLEIGGRLILTEHFLGNAAMSEGLYWKPAKFDFKQLQMFIAFSWVLAMPAILLIPSQQGPEGEGESCVIYGRQAAASAMIIVHEGAVSSDWSQRIGLADSKLRMAK